MAVSDPDLSRMDLDAVADLAMLRLDACERQSIQNDFEFILRLADSLIAQSPDASAPDLPQETPLRADVARPSCQVEILLQNAPVRRDDFFFVPQNGEGEKEPDL